MSDESGPCLGGQITEIIMYRKDFEQIVLYKMAIMDRERQSPVM